MTSPCLALDHVSRHFGGLKAVDDVTLTVQPGERHALIGPNGAGKTTLFNVISGELPASEGRITVFGTDVTRMAPHRRAALGLARTFQITKLFTNLTVMENLLLACEALEGRKLVVHRGVSSYPDLTARAAALIERFGLTGRSGDYARNLSYGEQRKLEVALSMAGRPRLLLLDEPMAGLSAGESQSMHAILEQIRPVHRRAAHRARHGHRVCLCRARHRAPPGTGADRGHARAGERQPRRPADLPRDAC